MRALIEQHLWRTFCPHIQLVDYVTGEALPHKRRRLVLDLRMVNAYHQALRLDDLMPSCGQSGLYVSCNLGYAGYLGCAGDVYARRRQGYQYGINCASAGFNQRCPYIWRPLASATLPFIRMVQSSQVTVLDGLPWAEHPVNSGTFTVREDTCQIKADKFICSQPLMASVVSDGFQFILSGHEL